MFGLVWLFIVCCLAPFRRPFVLVAQGYGWQFALQENSWVNWCLSVAACTGRDVPGGNPAHRVASYQQTLGLTTFLHRMACCRSCSTATSIRVPRCLSPVWHGDRHLFHKTLFNHLSEFLLLQLLGLRDGFGPSSVASVLYSCAEEGKHVEQVFSNIGSRNQACNDSRE